MPITEAQVWLFFWLHIGVILVVTAYYVMAAAIWPTMASRAALRFGRRWWLAMLIGVLISVPVVVLSIVFANIQPIAPVGVIGGLLWLLLGLIGGSGMAMHIGRGGQEMPPAKAALRGGLMLTLAWALPLIGWFIVLPLTLATGIGCLVLGMIPIKGAAAASSVRASSPGGGMGEHEFSFAQREESV